MVRKSYGLTHILGEPVMTEEQIEKRFRHVFRREMTLHERRAFYFLLCGVRRQEALESQPQEKGGLLGVDLQRRSTPKMPRGCGLRFMLPHCLISFIFRHTCDSRGCVRCL